MKTFCRSAASLLIGILLISLASADEKSPGSQSGVEALRAVEKSGELGKGGQILGMVGFFGEPEPVQWLVLTDQAKKPGALIELVVRDGEILAERKVKRDASRDMPSIPFASGQIQINSGEASRIAGDLARDKGIPFATMHFQLRCRDERNEPVWTIHLINRDQVAVGVHYISAVSGEVLRSVWHVDEVPKHSLSQRSPEEGQGRSIRLVRPVSRTPEL